MRAKAGINVFAFDALAYTYLGFNLANPKFADKRVRQALAYATDKQQLVNLIFKGLASPAYAPTAPLSWAYAPDVPQYLHDPEKARQLLREAGVKNLAFTILLNQGNKEREKAAIILQQQYKKVGVKVNLRVMEWSALLKIVNADKDPKDFEAVLMGWSLGLDPDNYSIWHSSEYPRGFNFIKYGNPAVDRLLGLGRTTLDKAKRKTIYARLNYLIAEDQPYIFLWYPKAIAGVRDRVGGLSHPGPAGMFLELEKVFVEKKQ
jgi:peptide/nickel transport system substrate-binding protein